jgi:hypothetical protein
LSRHSCSMLFLYPNCLLHKPHKPALTSA